MFKTIAIFTGALIIGSSVSAQSNPDILKKWDVSNKFTGGLSLYCAKGHKATKKYAADNSGSGSLKVKVIKSDLKSFTNIQLSFLFNGKIEKGKKYRIKISLQANQPGQIMATAIMDHRPWRELAKKAYVKANIQPGKSKDITMEFIAEKNFKKTRVPCLYLGKLKPGTEMSIKSIVFERIASK
jgi:hypothetical protein